MNETERKIPRPSFLQRSISFYRRRPMLIMLGLPAIVMIALFVDAYIGRDSFRNETVAIIGENINCRSDPNINGSVIRKISGYAEFKSKKSDGDWVQIEAGEQACWVNATYVVLDAQLKAAEGEQPRMVEYLKSPASGGG